MSVRKADNPALFESVGSRLRVEGNGPLTVCSCEPYAFLRLFGWLKSEIALQTLSPFGASERIGLCNMGRQLMTLTRHCPLADDDCTFIGRSSESLNLVHSQPV